MNHRPNPLNPAWREPGDPLYIQTSVSHVRPMVEVRNDDGTRGRAARWPHPFPGHRLSLMDDIEHLEPPEPPGGGS